MNIPTLTTTRLILRPIENGDVDGFTRIWADWADPEFARAGLWSEPGWPGVEAIWYIGRPWWGRGYAVEAAAAYLHEETHAIYPVSREDWTAPVCQPRSHRW
ncbi:GNAT family N-acetyltransferase [Frankia tisae]|uniref:GNAT family N-acetyltransferase n=1 Tax=Frankia tisae TaxID=2950104 RepID=UPI0021C13B99|nr:GNAT family N-acetyltransferase [Frankia tisae]